MNSSISKHIIGEDSFDASNQIMVKRLSNDLMHSDMSDLFVCRSKIWYSSIAKF